MLNNILKTKNTRWLMAALLCGANLMAEDEQGRGVARLSLLQGDVSVRRGDSGEWVAAAPNAPLVVEDRVLTGVNSQAEVQFDYANIARVAPNSELRLAELEYRRYTLQVAAGTVMFNVLRNSEADVEVSTSSVAVRPSKRGMYRITVLADGTTEVTVRSGEVDVFTTQGSERLKSGRTLVARGTASEVQFRVEAAIPRDEFDRWNERRNQDLERSTSYRYVDPSVYGAEDLDSHGTWVQDAPYGWVWTPRVAAGWSPYRYGRWSWVDYYGWSWVSHDPWGWAPYHYGRWYWGSRGWCWWPGAMRTRHFWSPGLVAWVGFGNGMSGGLGFGRVGWVPLAPYETYNRWYGWNRYRGFGNRNYIDNSVTIVNNYNIRNSYRNARVINGVHSVDGNDFARGRFNNITAARDNDLSRASLVRGGLPVAPERSSLRWADREVNGNPQSRDNAQFFSRRAPGTTTTARVSFEDQRRGMTELSRKTFGEGIRAEQSTAGRAPVNVEGNRGTDGIRRGRESNVEANVQPGGNNPDGNSNDGRGWRRLGEANTNDATGRESGTTRRFGEPRSADSLTAVESKGNDAGNTRTRDNAERSGWRRFGEPSGTTNRGVESSIRESTERGLRTRPQEASPSASPSPAAERSRDSGWRRFENNGSSGSSGVGSRRSESPTPRVERSTPRSEESRPTPRMERTAPRESAPRESTPRGGSVDRRRGNDQSGGESIRMSPPTVRERSRSMESSGQRAPQWEGRSSRSGSYGGFGGSAPRSSGSMVGGRSSGGSSMGRSSGGGWSGGGGRGGSSGGGSMGRSGGGSSGGGGRGRGR